ncbi:DUF937 domain-containing protein [Sphingosinicellaceae bacterium]|nr:DUF937 domain-containing protein [Sphingosinicellaceae bacterium]
MSQQLLDLISRFGGAGAIDAMAAKVGLSPEQVQSAMAALMPAVAGGMTKQADAGTLDQYAAPAAELANPSAVATEASIAHGNDLAGKIFGGAAGSQAVTTHAAQATGLDAGILAQLLPMVTTLAAGTLAGKSSGPQGAAGTLMSMLDVNKDGNPLDDIMGFAGKLFGKA